MTSRKQHNLRKEQIRDFFEEMYEEQAAQQIEVPPPPPPGPPPVRTASIVRSNSTPSKSTPLPVATNARSGTERFTNAAGSGSNSLTSSPLLHSSSPHNAGALSARHNAAALRFSGVAVLPRYGFVASASTTSSPYASPYASPRNSLTNVEPISGGASPLASPTPPVRSHSLPASRSTSGRNCMLRSSGDQQTPPPTVAAGGGMFDDLERSIASLSTDNDLSSAATTVATIRVCIFHIIAAYETSVSTSPLLRGASTAVSDAVSLRTLLHPLLPDTWRIVGRQLTDTLYCVVRRDNWRNGNNNNHSSSGGGGGGGGISSSSSSSNSNSTTVGGNAPAGSENWLAYIEERWQNLSASTVPDTGAMFSGKNAIVLSCPVAPLIVSSAADNVVFHEAATRALYRVYEQAQAKTLYPYLVLLGGKALKTVLRKSLARHLFDLGFGEYRVHWHGLSSKADAAFVGDITRLWQSLATQSEQL